MFNVRRSTERSFFKKLQKLFQRLVERFLKGDGSPGFMERILRGFFDSPEAEKHLNQIVSGMVKAERVETARSWREAALKGSNARKIFRAISQEMKGPVGHTVEELIAENARYIKTVPSEWADYITRFAYEEVKKGKRPEEVEAELQKIMPEHITKNLKTIARTECSKANAAIAQSRAEACGIKAYFWRCCRDERTRHSHRKMDGVLVFYNDPPSPEALFPGAGQRAYGNYHAGNTFNCRCYQEPVVDVRFLPDTIRVHDNGSVVTMTKAQIVKKYGKIS